MGPILDERGLEQGGVSSSDFYKIFGKEQLEASQVSGLGVNMRDITVSSVGQADDTVLLANNIYDIQNLLELTLNFCSKYQVQLCHEKTKLQAFFTKRTATLTDYQKDTSSINIAGEPITFAYNVEHVGVIRSSSGNLANIQTRIVAHKRALGAVLHTGMAKGHRGNPLASIRVDNIYGVPVLFSGLASLALKKVEIDLIDQHVKRNVDNLLRLPVGTPRPVTAFLSGTLPGKAQLHIKQLALFAMITRLPGNILHQHAWNSLVASKPCAQSWFTAIRDLCLLYGLPHPSHFLEQPSTKASFKSLVHKKIISHWEFELRQEAEVLPSLEYFKPNFMSLTRPHPLFLTAGSSSYETTKATVQAKMLSGRYRTKRLCRHWSLNKQVVCLLSTCSDLYISEDLPHILAKFRALESTRSRLMKFTEKRVRNLPPEARDLVTQYCNPTNLHFVHFLLDCSHYPAVI